MLQVVSSFSSPALIIFMRFTYKNLNFSMAVVFWILCANASARATEETQLELPSITHTAQVINTIQLTNSPTTPDAASVFRIAPAPNFSFKPSLKETFEYDTNPLLTEEGQRALFGLVSEPDLTVADTTPTQSVALNTRLDLSRFNLANFSSSDVHSTLQAKQIASYGFLQFNGNFDYDTTRTSELLSSGLNIAGIRHTGINFSPEIGLQLLPLDLFTTQASYNSSEYGSPRYINYQEFQIVPTLSHTINLENSAIATIQASHYKTTSGLPAVTDAVGPGLGWYHRFTELFFGQITGGYYFINSKLGENQNNRREYFFNFNVSYTGLSDNLSLALSRDLSPQSTALQISTTSLTLQERHALTPRISTTLNVIYRDDAVPQNTLGQQANFIEANANIRYMFTETTTLSLGYRFRQQKTAGSALMANSNALLVSLILSPGQFSLVDN